MPAGDGDLLKQMQDVGKKAGLKGIEIVVGVVIAEEWTPENVGCSL